uniref:DNA polymerase III subunit delta n=1 Tax=Eiseniibacteriota bacterium TaxID=2212470 RepID=A0A832MK46_UNCEI
MPVVTLSELLAQDRAAAFLRGVVAGRRYANAYLFHGPAGVGKGTAAFAFARALLCDGVAPRAAQAPGLFDAPPAPVAAAADDACGRCAGCGKVARLQHPDLKFLFPVSGEEKTLDDTILETTRQVVEDPFFVFQYEKFASIRLSLTRELLRELAYRPYEAERRVVIVRDADRMREDQYSAMLKSIEEPGAATVWVLTTSRLNRLPATIRSRCQRVRFVAWGEGAIRRFLVDRAGIAQDEAGLLAALAAGSLGRALELREREPLTLRREAFALLETALRRDPSALWSACQHYMKFGRTGRETLRRMVEFHQLWLRDLLRARYGMDAAAFVHRDHEAQIRAEAATVDAAEIRRRLLVLEEMLRAIEGNVTPELAIFSGLVRLVGGRMGEGEWPRHATARWDY